MRAPRPTTREIRSLLEREVEALTRLGTGQERAIAEVARRHRLPPLTVSNLLGRVIVGGIDLASP